MRDCGGKGGRRHRLTPPAQLPTERRGRFSCLNAPRARLRPQEQLVLAILNGLETNGRETVRCLRGWGNAGPLSFAPKSGRHHYVDICSKIARTHTRGRRGSGSLVGFGNHVRQMVARIVTVSFPVAICLVGAVADFLVWSWLGRFRVSAKPPASRARLSIEERQRKITIARWIIFGSGWVFLAGAGLLMWLQNSR